MQEKIDTMLKLKEVISLVSLSRSTIYVYIKKNEFPKPVKLTDRRIAWRSSDIQSYLSKKQC